MLIENKTYNLRQEIIDLKLSWITVKSVDSWPKDHIFNFGRKTFQK